MKSNKGALRPRLAAALLLVLFRGKREVGNSNPKQLNNQQRGQHRRLGNAHGAREDPEAASFRRARNAPWAALAGCIMLPNLFRHTMSGLHVVCLFPQAYFNKLRLAALEVLHFISLWCLAAQRKGMVIYMIPSAAEAQGLVRADKHPKSTRYGRQHPISERWNSEEQLAAWRAAWADVSNRYLERAGREERIDHRSNAARGLDEIPTIHEGVTAQALECKGIISDRCEINRQIKADNTLLRELKAEIKKLAALVARTVPAIAEGLEKLRSRVLIFCYQLRHIGVGKYNLGNRVKAVKPELERYAGLVQQIKEKSEERKKLLAEKKKTQFYQIPKLHDFTRRITELTEEIEELKTEKNFLLRSLNCADDADISDVKKEIATLEIALKKLDEQEVKYATELEDAMKQYAELNAQVADMDAVELKDARLIIRPDRERSATDRIKAAYGEKYDPVMMHDSKRDVANLLNEETGARSVRNLLRQTQKMQQMQQRREPKRHERER